VSTGKKEKGRSEEGTYTEKGTGNSSYEEDTAETKDMEKERIENLEETRKRLGMAEKMELNEDKEIERKELVAWSRTRKR
jgi:hypothetical protein